MAKEKIFANKIEKKINNNEEIYFSSLKNEKIKEEKKNTKNIFQKINDIFNSKNYVYKADVVITTNNGELNKRIIGKNSKYLITADNELILISEIKDIRYQ